MGSVRRRKFLAAAGALLAAPPLFAQQPGRSYRIVLFLGGSSVAAARQRRAIVERLATHGFREGQNLRVDMRIGSFSRAIDGDVARALVAAQPDAIFAYSEALALRMREATSTIPIVFAGVADPVAAGLVKTFRHPGGNVTGVHFSQLEIGAKRLELLRELLPGARRVVIAGDFGDPGLAGTAPHLREVASRLGFELTELSESWIFGFNESALEAVASARPEAVVTGQPWAMYGREEVAQRLVRFATDQRIPSVFWESEMAERGATLSYGVNVMNKLGRAADQLARVLKGAKPVDLPVDQATAYELVVNNKRARAIGIMIPQSVLLRADRVIE